MNMGICLVVNRRGNLSGRGKCMDIDQSSAWLNDFLFWDALLVGLFISVDWWLGDRQRKILLRKCRRLFLDFRHRQILPIYARHATAALTIIERRLGELDSGKFAYKTALIAFVPTFIVLSLVSFYIRQDPKFLQNYPGYGWAGTAKTILCNSVAIYVVFYLSTYLSIRLLATTRKILPSRLRSGTIVVQSQWGVFKLLFLAAGSMILLFFGTVLFLWIAESLSKHPDPVFMDIRIVYNKLLGTIPFYLTGSPTPHYRWTTSILVILAVSPLILHLLLSAIFLIGRAASIVANRIVSVLLLRVSQGKQGVLRQAALFVGSGAKIIEMGIKSL